LVTFVELKAIKMKMEETSQKGHNKVSGITFTNEKPGFI